MVALVLSLVYDPDEEIRKSAQIALMECVGRRKGTPELAAAIFRSASELPRLRGEARQQLADVLAYLREEAASAAPVFASMIDSSDPITRAHILGALAAIEPKNSQWPVLLRELLTSADKAVADVAEHALIHVGK